MKNRARRSRRDHRSRVPSIVMSPQHTEARKAVCDMTAERSASGTIVLDAGPGPAHSKTST